MESKIYLKKVLSIAFGFSKRGCLDKYLKIQNCASVCLRFQTKTFQCIQPNTLVVLFT